MSDELALACHACHAPMTRVLEQASPDGMAAGVRLEAYQCHAADCGRKIVVIYEPVSGLTEEQTTWVEREVARAGAFFPSDYVGGVSRAQRWERR